jgi:hypothetical protein
MGKINQTDQVQELGHPLGSTAPAQSEPHVGGDIEMREQRAQARPDSPASVRASNRTKGNVIDA